MSVSANAKEVDSPNVIINLPSRTLELYTGNTFIKEYPVAVGKPSTPTPLGNFCIDTKERNPTWIPPDRDYVVLSGPDNPLGYRWMGFLSSYGIHGTNAPWTIGMTVSNGCIRMREEDAEELFDIVKVETPVKIIYEQIKISIGNKGQASIAIYPDIYELKSVTLDEVNRKLAEFGCRGLISNDVILQIIREKTGKQVPFAKFHNLKINDQILMDRAVTIGDNMYVPVWAVAAANKSNIIWDEQNQLVWKEKRVVGGIVRGNIIYCKVEDIQKLFGMQQTYKEEENVLELNMLSVLVNDKSIGVIVGIVDDVIAIPGLILADFLKKNAKFDIINKIFILEGQSIPFALIDNQPFIKITNIKEIFNANVFWNRKNYSIEITY